jgi:pectate lyase
MKFLFTATLATLASLVTATPTPTIEKRASANDACDIGYASTNGG